MSELCNYFHENTKGMTYEVYPQNKKELEKWIENTLVSIALLKDIPKESVSPDLETWKKESTVCGTQYCFGGWLAQVPFFQKQGLMLELHGEDFDGEVVELVNTKTGESNTDCSESLFGTDSLFHWRYSEKFHKEDKKAKNDKDVIRRRLKTHLNNLLLAEV